MLRQWYVATIGVANLDLALAFWIDAVGYEVVASAEGSDIGLAQQWNIEPSSIKRQALIAPPGATHGHLHLIQMHESGPSVRGDAAAFDACPKNIDIYVTDIGGRINALKALGYNFRSATHSEVTADDGTRFREMHISIHDDINLVLLELPDQPIHTNTKGFGAIGPIICVVPNVSQEKLFYIHILGLELLADNYFEGKDIERMIGLPPGAGLDVSIWGREGDREAQLELVEYTGVGGGTRYSLATLPNCGLHQVCFETTDASEIASKAKSSNNIVIHRGVLHTLAGSGEYWSIYTPAGMRIDLMASS
ncbi:MAG: catechol 2,3-dioxygenase-like lactoylglutathione lyase family enzyme [Flavobacteriales bacterium]|jgi:catechol 2,3-dioxygenase-like lactoylglutathione lyase family enzyme